MTSLERVLAALRGEAADRRAHTLTLSLYGARLSGCPMRDYFSDPRRYLEGQNEVVRRLDPDILFTPFALPLEALAYGGEAVWFDRFPPNLRKPPFRDADQVQPLGEMLLAAPGMAYLLDATTLLARAHGGEKPVCAVVTAPVDLPAMLLGIEGWLEVLLFQPDRAEALLDLARDHFLRLTAAFFAAGAAFVACPVMFANLRLVTSGLLEGRILPALARAFGQVQGPVVFHHGGNRILDHLPHYAVLPNVAGFVLDPRDNLAQARDMLGPGRLMLGNLNGPALSRMQSGDVYRVVSNSISRSKREPSLGARASRPHESGQDDRAPRCFEIEME